MRICIAYVGFSRWDDATWPSTPSVCLPSPQRDIEAMGCGVDWRRSFVTTEVNPFYDRFIRWQFNTLKAQGRVVKDKRYGE